MTDRPSTQTLTYHDPSRCFDGSPYEAARAAAEQAESVITLAILALHDTNTQARNAYMQRNIDTGNDPGGADWVDERQAEIVREALDALELATRKVRALKAAASYDPKAPAQH